MTIQSTEFQAAGDSGAAELNPTLYSKLLMSTTLPAHLWSNLTQLQPPVSKLSSPFLPLLLPFSPSSWILTHLSERQIEEENEYLIIVYYLLDNSIGTK